MPDQEPVWSRRSRLCLWHGSLRWHCNSAGTLKPGLPLEYTDDTRAFESSPRSSSGGLTARPSRRSASPPLLAWFRCSEEPWSAAGGGRLSLQQWQAGALGFFGKREARVARVVLGVYAGPVRHELLD